MKQIGKYVILKEEELNDIARLFHEIYKEASKGDSMIVRRLKAHDEITGVDGVKLYDNMLLIENWADTGIKRITWRRNS